MQLFMVHSSIWALVALMLACQSPESRTEEARLARWQDSVQIYSQRITQGDDTPPNRTRRCMAYQQLGKLLEAQLDAEAALALDPDYAPAFIAFGSLSYLKGDTDGARKAYDRAIELKPESADFRMVRGSYYWEIGDTESAVFDYAKAHELAPETPLPLFHLGVVEFHRGQYTKALQQLNQSLQSDLRYAPAYYARALVNDSLHDPSAALNDYSTAIRLDSAYAEAFVNRGGLYLRINRPDLACPDLQAGVSLGYPVPDSLLQRACAN
jgi:tetratricopeptide (TPR) repeat protein